MLTNARHYALSALTLVLAAAPLTGCADDDTSSETSTFTTTLTRAQSCDELLDLFQKDAVAKVDQEYRNALDPDYYWGDDVAVGGPARGGVDEEFGAPTAGNGGEQNDGGGEGPDGFSETNNQVEGVDEADILKTDGENIWLLHGNELMTLQAWPPQSLDIQQSVTIEGNPTEMYVTGGKAVVFSSVAVEGYGKDPGYGDYSPGGGGGFVDEPGRAEPGMAADDIAEPGYYYANFTKITVLSLDGDTPVTERELYVEGTYNSARRHGSVVRAIVSGGFAEPGILWNRPWGNPLDSQFRAELNAWRAEAIRVIKARTLEDWMPTQLERKGEELSRTPFACNNYYVPTSGTSNYGMTSVVGLDLDDVGGLTQGGVSGYAEHVYASDDTLVLAQTEWSEGGFFDPGGESTVVHTFALGNETPSTIYNGSGAVPGRLHNQFSIDERDGVLRLATTQWRWNDGESVNEVFTIGNTDGDLALEFLGRSGAMAPGETIFSTRFVGDKAYVVTFRQVDPLFVVDLGNPAKPTVLGELKIPGFSDYMHPLDENHLLTIGRDVDEDGFSNDALALQIFDVSDATQPALDHKHVFTKEGYSEANYNHKAFTFYDGKLAFPFVSWGYDGQRTSLEVFAVSADNGFNPLGSIDHTALVEDQMCEVDYGKDWGEDEPAPVEPCYYYWGNEVRRGVFIDDYVYSISYGGIQIHAMDNMSDAIASLPLPAPQGSGYYY